MQKLKTIPVFRDATEATTSDVYENKKGDTITLQLSGTATTFSIVVEGLLDSEYKGLAMIKLADFSTVSNGSITGFGQYMTTIAGIAYYRFRLVTVEGGNVSLTACITANCGG